MDKLLKLPMLGDSVSHINNSFGKVLVRKHGAFTLAEVLIVIAIIGIISSLVLPNLIASNNERIAVTRLNKVYSTLNETHRRAVSVYGPVPTWFSGCSNLAEYSKRYAERVIEFLNVAKNCGFQANQGCFSKEAPKHHDNSVSDIIDVDTARYKVILSDGPSIGFYLGGAPFGKNEAADNTDINNPFFRSYGGFTVDIDGPNKGANTWGIDLFSFLITQKGIYPTGSLLNVATLSDALLKGNCMIKSYRCAAWVLETGNMEYLKTDATGKCPNGSFLGWKKTTCD